MPKVCCAPGCKLWQPYPWETVTFASQGEVHLDAKENRAPALARNSESIVAGLIYTLKRTPPPPFQEHAPSRVVPPPFPEGENIQIFKEPDQVKTVAKTRNTQVLYTAPDVMQMWAYGLMTRLLARISCKKISYIWHTFMGENSA